MTTTNDGVQTALDAYASIREWQASFRNFWRDDGPPPEWVEIVSRFASRNETDPDAIVDEILRPAPSGEGLLLRTRARRKYVRLTNEFEHEEGRAAANAVRSFLIHNGVAMTPSILR